ncbi:MAG: thioredoxin fold domain-containing protein [Armatimonadetes bacterium]|nr:thioredoxin fold domain-containing protein [Armatimonadota bacterium]NIM67836.1 thioredoxin fold domain-containing protein [Armatimonadota bacterium]NIM76367.1 thioredoxin fold domain-containing protein [Armatimonadota bacterium]NIN06066.1 thioredoxin fold domain-containing protein [Armatimonadota bacterium]NIO74550.1 thioredoxin fold domain-containing protein [Armatimonadota bacterium]
MVLIIALAAAVVLISQTAKRPTTVPQLPTPAAGKTHTTTPISPQEMIQWAPDLDTALAEARQQGKKVMVDFHKELCRFCKKLDEETFPDPEVVSLVSQNLIAVKIDVTKNSGLAGKYGVHVTPTLVVTDAEGDEIGRILGFMPPEAFQKQLSNILSS